MKKVFVSGCYDILHAGHVQFFEDARKLGDHLTVCFASDKVLAMAKGRKPAMPEDNKKILIGSLACVDAAVKSSDLHPIFDFVGHLRRLKPDILAVTEDDGHIAEKKALCKHMGISLVVLSKRNRATRVSTTKILQNIGRKAQVPLRVDFAGGWLDVPKFSRRGGFIVNCAISPLCSDQSWPYEISGGLGGSAARAILDIKDGVRSELNLGVGWQDPAVIEETGLCVWRSGKIPVLDFKTNPDWLKGKMLIFFTGKPHYTPGLVDKKRDYDLIYRAGAIAREAARDASMKRMAEAVGVSYDVQLREGMKPLKDIKGALARKYLGGGHGGYALYLFDSATDRDVALVKYEKTSPVEPYIKEHTMLD
jgi:cytidyltransferase-like protein